MSENLQINGLKQLVHKYVTYINGVELLSLIISVLRIEGFKECLHTGHSEGSSIVI